LVFVIGIVSTLLGLGAEVKLHLFWAQGCPNCTVMKAFLKELKGKYPELAVVEHEVAFHPGQWRLMVRLAQAYGIEAEETPVVFVGDVATVGVGRTVEMEIEEEVARCIAQGCPSPLERLPPARGIILSPLEAALIALGAVLILLFILR